MDFNGSPTPRLRDAFDMIRSHTRLTTQGDCVLGGFQGPKHMSVRTFFGYMEPPTLGISDGTY